MKVPVSFLFLLSLVIFSCNKDKFTTEPQITVKSISPSEVRQGTNGAFTVISLEARFTDNEGDLDSAIIVYKYYDGDVSTYTDTLSYYSIGDLKMPPKTREGDMTVQFEYNTNNSQGEYVTFPGVMKDTTATIGLILLDKAKHRSNYGESGKIRLIAP